MLSTRPASLALSAYSGDFPPHELKRQAVPAHAPPAAEARKVGPLSHIQGSSMGNSINSMSDPHSARACLVPLGSTTMRTGSNRLIA